MALEVIDSSGVSFEDVEAPMARPEGGIFSVLEQQTQSNSYIKSQANDLAKMRTALGGEDMVTEYTNAIAEIRAGGDPEALKRQESLRFASIADDQISQFIRENAATEDEAVREQVIGMIRGRDQIREDLVQQVIDLDGPQQAITEMYANESTSEFIKRKEASRGFALNHAMTWAEDRGLADNVWDLATTIFGLDSMKDAGDLTGRGEFADPDGLAMFIEEWQALDPDEQTELFPAFFERITEAYDDNEFKIFNVVNMMYDANYSKEIALGTAGDIIGIAALPFDIAALYGVGKAVKGIAATKVGNSAPDIADMKAAKGAASSRSQPKKMQDVGNDDAAAQAATSAGLDPEMSDAMGMGRLDSAATASPFRVDGLPVINAALDNISDKMLNLHRASIEQDIAKRTEELFNLRRGITANEKRRVAIGSVEIPRQIDKLKLEIRLLDKAIAKNKKTARSAKAREQTRLMQTVLAAKSRQMVGLNQELGRVRDLASRLSKTDNVNTDIARLKAASIPDRLSAAVREATLQQQNRAIQARSALPKLQDARKAKLDAVAKTSNGTVAKAIINKAMSTAVPKIVDDPLAFGLSEQYAEGLSALYRTQLDATVKDIESIAPEAIRNAGRKAAQQRAIDKITKAADEAGEEVRVADIVEMDDKGGFTLIYHRGGVDNSLEYRYTVNDAGEFDGVAELSESQARAFSNIFSPETLFKDLDSFLVNDLTFAGDQAARIGNILKRMYDDTRRGLSKAENAELDVLLKAGDEQGKVFAIDDLEAGLVETVTGKKKYNAKVIDSYYKSRVFYDELHSTREHFIRQQLEFLGYKDFTYVNAKGEAVQFIGKPRENFRGLDIEGDPFIWLPGEVQKGSTAYRKMSSVRRSMKAWQDEGYKIVDLMEPQEFKDGGKVRFALVADDLGVKERALPRRVLNYKPGYIPRIYRPGYYFVKDVTRPERPSTMFAAETREIAERLAQEAMETDNSVKLAVKSDREFTDLEKLVIDSDAYGGLYTGARKQVDIMVRGLDGQATRPERASVADATERYLQNIAAIMPMNQYRIATMKRFTNSVNKLAKDDNRQGMNPTDFFGPMDLAPTQLKIMEQARDYLTAQLRIPTNEERGFRLTMQKAADSLYGGMPGVPKKISDGVRKALLNTLDTDPIQTLKGYTFNLNLGWFNVRQLLVQVQNAGNAMAISPKHAPAALADALPMRMAVLSPDENVWKAAARFSTTNEKDFIETVRQFRQSGLADSIIRQGDYDANVLTIGGQTMELARKAARAGRVFFNEGEIMARLLSFNIARRRLGPNATTREIFDEHLRLSTNMQSANAASWQKNWLGLPTQYMQVFAKFYERVAPEMLMGKSKWTGQEKLRVLGFQVGMYGTLGIPIAEEAYAYLAEINGKTPKQMQEQMPWVQEMFEEGLVGTVAHAFGFENNFSKDFSLLSGVGEKVDGMVDVVSGIASTGTADVDAARLLLGPSLTSITRTWDAGVGMAHAAIALTYNPTLDQLGTEAINVLDNIASLTSTWSAARKAIFLHDIGIVSKRGATLIDADQFEDISLATLAARAMNFETDIETAYWRLKDVNRERRNLRQAELSDLKNAYLQAMRTGDMDMFYAMQAWILAGKTDSERRKIMDSVIKGATGDSDFDTQAREYMNNFIINGGNYTISPSTSEFQ